MKKILALLGLLLLVTSPVYAGLKAVSSSGGGTVANGGTGAASGSAAFANLISSADTLRYTRQALANTGTTTTLLKMLVVGDSTDFGVAGGNWYTSWPSQFAASLEEHDLIGNTCAWPGDGTTSARRNLDTRVSAGTSWTSYDDTDTTFGGGVWSATTSTNKLGYTCQTETNTGVWFYEINGLGTCTVDVDGSTTHVLDESGAQAVGVYTASTTTAYHTFNVAETSGTCKILGFYAYDNTLSQLLVVNGGMSGWNSSDISGVTLGNAALPWSPLQMLSSWSPNFSWLEGGIINDPVGGVSLTQSTTNFTSLVSELQGIPSDVIMRTGDPANPSSIVHQVPTLTQESYANVQRNVAASSNPVIPVYDVRERWVSYAISNPLGYYEDDYVHPLPIGYADIANGAAAFVFAQTSGGSIGASSNGPVRPGNYFIATGPLGYRFAPSVNGLSCVASETGYCNSIIVGSGAGVSMTASVGYQSVAVGFDALNGNGTQVSGIQNTVGGYQAGFKMTTGSSNTAWGNAALTANTTGAQNTAVGLAALTANTTGTNNTALGYRAGRYLVTAQHGTSIGSNAGAGGSGGVTGSSNTIVGDSVASTTLTTGSNNILVGTSSATDTAGATDTHEIAIGGLGLGSNTFEIGLSGTTTAGTLYGALNLPGLATSSAATSGTLCWTTSTGLVNVDTTLACLSSLEELKDIQGPITAGLETVNKMNPFWFKWKKTTEQYSGDKREQPGLGAHAMEKIEPRLVDYDAKGKLRGIRYQELTAVLVAAIKDQQTEIEQIKHTNEVSNDPCKAFNRFGRWIMGCK